MKKILSVILSIILMLTIFSTGLFSITASALTNYYGRCNENITWSTWRTSSERGPLVVSGVGSFGTGYSTWRSTSGVNIFESIDNVILNEGITGIYSDTFRVYYYNMSPTYCRDISSLTVPTTLTFIGSSAFYRAPIIYITDLKKWCEVECESPISTIYLNGEELSGKLKIPDSVTNIGQGVFYFQKSITGVDIPSSVTSIGKNAFYGSTSLKEAIVSGNCPITADCKLDNIVDLEIRGDVDTINSSFNNFKKLQQLTINEGVVTIEDNAFEGCSKLTQVTLPNTIKEIGANAFNQCNSLTDIYFDGTILEWIDITKESGNTALSSATIHCSEIADIADTVPNVSNVTYNSEEQCPTVTINGLTEGVDFTVEYSNNINVGTANAVVKGINTCSGEQQITFEILPANISGASVTGITDKTFTNDNITQNITVKMFGKTLTEGVDYTIGYANNTNAGEASISISGIGNYTGTWNSSFNINTKNISSAVVENIEDKTFDCQYFTQENIMVSVDGIVLVKDKDYTVSYNSNYNAGTASVIVAGKGNYSGSITKYFRINSRDINETSISGILSKEYDTSAQTQAPTLTYKGRTLSSSDFKITYTNNTNYGTATMTVTGKNNFTGSFIVNFEITQADISDCTITGISNKVYTGNPITQSSISVYLGTKKLSENIHYTISYTNNIYAGTASVIISGIGNCRGEETKQFTIEKKTNSKAPTPVLVRKTISSIEIQTIDGMEYKIDNGDWQSSSVFTNLTEGVTYQISQRWAETVAYKPSPVSDSIYVTTSHAFDNACDKECNICGFVRTVPDHIYTNTCDTTCNVCGAIRNITHTYDNDCDTVCNVCGSVRSITHTYDNACDTTCNICGEIRTVNPHEYDNDCDTTCNVCNSARTIIHHYKTVITKATLTKNGSTVKTCSVCKNKTVSTIKYVKTIKLSKTSYTYNGKTQKPSVTVKDSSGKTLKKDTDYTVTYSSGCKNAGTYKVTIKLKGNYSGTKTLYFKIKKLDISKASLKFTKSKYYYTQKSIKAKISTANSVKIPSSSIKYAYKNNKNVGKATVIVKASGNFTGTKKLTYKIYPKPSATSVTISVGAKKSFSAASSSKVKYTIGNKKIIKYTNGKIVALKAGTTTIKATSNGISTSIKVTVKKPYLNKTSVNAHSGYRFTLKLIDGSGKITWSSSNSKIAKVSSSGKVTPLKYGTCYIYAKQNGKTYKCKVSVSKYYKGTDIPDFGALKGILPFSTENSSDAFLERYTRVTVDEANNYYDKLKDSGFKYFHAKYVNGIYCHFLYREIGDKTQWASISDIYDDDCFDVYVELI